MVLAVVFLLCLRHVEKKPSFQLSILGLLNKIMRSICSCQLNIWHAGHCLAPILNWFLLLELTTKIASADSRIVPVLHYDNDISASGLIMQFQAWLCLVQVWSSKVRYDHVCFRSDHVICPLPSLCPLLLFIVEKQKNAVKGCQSIGGMENCRVQLGW